MTNLYWVGGGKNARHRGRQTNGENKNREPSTFYFFLIFRIMLNFFEEPKFIKGYQSVKNIIFN